MKFTPLQIEYILSDIKCLNNIPQETAESMLNNIKRDLTKQLSNVVITTIHNQDDLKKMINALKNEITKYYHSSQIDPGSMPGAIGGQSIGQPVTQSTLNSFHMSGVASARVKIMGIKKFKEILNATQNPNYSSCSLYYEEEVSKSIGTLRDFIGNSLMEVRLEMVIKKTEFIYDINTIDFNNRWWYRAFNMFNLGGEDNIYRKWCIRFTLDKSKLFKYRLTPKIIADNLEKYDDIKYLYSPLDEGILDVFVSTKNLIIPPDCPHPTINESTKLHIYLKKIVCKHLISQQISGIKGIEEIFFTKNDKTNCWVVETQGTNMKELLKLKGPIFSKTESNDMWEIYRLLGIEAARKFIINEITNFISFDGTYIDHHHVSILVDMMTWSGEITSVARYGIDRSVGPFAKASFEESMENLLKAGIYNENDSTKGVSSSIVMGKLANIGTNSFDLVTDINMIINNSECFDKNSKTESIEKSNKLYNYGEYNVINNVRDIARDIAGDVVDKKSTTDDIINRIDEKSAIDEKSTTNDIINTFDENYNDSNEIIYIDTLENKKDSHNINNFSLYKTVFAQNDRHIPLNTATAKDGDYILGPLLIDEFGSDSNEEQDSGDDNSSESDTYTDSDINTNSDIDTDSDINTNSDSDYNSNINCKPVLFKDGQILQSKVIERL